MRSYSGRIRHLPQIYSSEDYIKQEAERQAVNSPVQEFASSLGVMATSSVEHEIDDAYLACIAFVHDAIYAIVPKRYVLWGARTLKRYMESVPIKEWFGIDMKVPILADVSFGENMGDTHELKGLTSSGPYDFSRFADGDSPIIVPRQIVPPNNGRRTSSIYTGY